MRELIGMAAFLAAAIPATAIAAAPSPWQGRYVYEESAGRTAGGSPILVTWTLTIDAKGGCRIVAQGFQTNSDLRCTAHIDHDRLRVDWLSHADGGQQNQYGVVTHKPGDHLFTLTRSGGAIETRWGTLTTNIENKRPGRYFRKTA